MNGSGKSSLLEILYRAINNLGAVLLKDFKINAAADLMYVGGLYADVKYTIDESIGILSVRGFQVGLKFDNQKWLFKIQDEPTNIDFEDFIYYPHINNDQLLEICKHIFIRLLPTIRCNLIFHEITKEKIFGFMMKKKKSGLRTLVTIGLTVFS